MAREQTTAGPAGACASRGAAGGREGRREFLRGVLESAGVIGLFLAFGILCAVLALLGLGLRTALPRLDSKLLLVALMAAGGVAYGGALVVLFGKDFVTDLKRLRRGVSG